MKFASFPIDDAKGVVLAHTLDTGAATFKKGRVLSAADVAAIKAGGRREVIGARLEPGDVDEDTAAALIAAYRAVDFPAGLKMAADSIDSGTALKKVEALREFTAS